VDLSEVGQLAKGVGVAEGDVDDAVVRECGQRGDGGAFLASASPSGGDEETGVFAGEASASPESACGVPECLLGGRV